MQIADPCQQQMLVTAQLHCTWRPWTSVNVENVDVKIRTPDGVQLAHTAFAGPRLRHGTQHFKINACAPTPAVACSAPSPAPRANPRRRPPRA